MLRLDQVELPGLKSGVLRERKHDLDTRDLALAEAIYLEVVKKLLRLQRVIVQFSGRPLKAIDPVVLKVLLVGAAQLEGMDRIHPGAVVDEAVEQARRFGRAKAAGMVNAVLRNIIRGRGEQVAFAGGWEELSMPREVWDRVSKLTSAEFARDFALHANQTPATTLRLIGDTSAEKLLACLEDADKPKLAPHEQVGFLVVEGARRKHLATWAEAVLAQPQDPTAALVAGECELSEGLSVLDRCAGLGTKTLQILEVVGKGAEIHAVDPNVRRGEGLQSIASQRGYSNLKVHPVAWLKDLPGLPREFDRVLVDAPCSNSGVFARRAEARYFQSAREFKSLERLQGEILADSAARVKVGGLLIYSTCSVWPEENAGLVAQFLGANPGFALKHERQTWPAGRGSSYRDGGYVGVLRRDR